MKFNWGTGIVIAITLFITYILFMVVTMMSTHTDVVESDYYAQQINYQATKEAKENGLEVDDSVHFEQTENFIKITFSTYQKNKEINKGLAYFYRAENAALDKKFELSPETGKTQLIPVEMLTKGIYTIKLSWEESGKNYLIERQFKVE